MKKILSTFMVLLLLFTSSISVYAADTIKPVIQLMKYSGEEYVPADYAAAGDILLLKVSFNKPVSSLATLRIKIEFEKECVTYIGGSFTPELVSGNMTAGNPVLEEKEGSVTVFFGKTGFNGGGTDEFLGGSPAQNIASFAFQCNGKAGTTKFKLTMDNAMSSDYSELVMQETTVTSKITIKSFVLTENEKAIFDMLEDITYNPKGDPSLREDSMQYIQMAEAIYNGYSPSEKLSFANQYPELFEAYRTARTRYFDEGLKADRAQLEAAAEQYRQTYHNILGLSSDAVDLSNYKDVRAAITAWEDLDKNSPQVTLLLLEEKEKLDTLEPVVEALEEQVNADKEAYEWFIDRYANILWNAESDDINDITYGEYEVNVASAKGDYKSLQYDLLSGPVKTKVDSLYQKLLQLEEKVKEEAKKAGEEVSVIEEITAFTEKWYSVTRLTMMTAGVKDATAMELFLEEFGKLSETAQTRLASRKSMVEQLLTYVKGLNGVQNSTNTGNTGVNVVPQGGTTVNQTIIEKETEKLVTQLQNNAVVRNIPTIVYVSILLLIGAVVTLPIPFVVYRLYKKREESAGESV